MAMTYEDGMAALTGMFPTWDRAVLEELLVANDGHLENTIDMALAMDAPAPATQPTTVSIPTPSPSAQRVASPRAASPRHTAPPPAPVVRASLPSSSRGSMRRSPSPRLPDDFLRLPGEPFVRASERQDAILAAMLQNEMDREQMQMQMREGSGGNDKSAAEIASETLTAVGEKVATVSEGMRVWHDDNATVHHAMNGCDGSWWRNGCDSL